MDGNHTTADIQRYLDELKADGGSSAPEEIVRKLLSRSVDRLNRLCANLLYRNYPRLTRGPLNLRPDEMLSAVVERLIKAMREVRPHNARAFFALANQHIRWELNDMARRLDQGREVELDTQRVANAAPTDGTTGSDASPGLVRILQAIDGLPDDERELFGLIRIQGMTHGEAAEVMGVSTKTVQRKLNQCVMLLSAQLRDLNAQQGNPSHR